MSSTTAGGQSGTVTAVISDRAYVPARPIVRIHLLGSMRATSYLGDDVLPRAKKARAALGYLCLYPGARMSRTRIATTLWDRASADQARASFRQALSDLTSAMGPLAAEMISTARATVGLNTDLCWIDALALVKSPYSDPATRADLAVLCPGELLEGFDGISESFGKWLAKERVHFKERLAASLNAVLQQIDRGDFDPQQVETVARRLLSFDPTHQDAWNAVMRALAKLGEREHALREYERCRETLWEAARIKPLSETEQLYQRIRAQAARATDAPTGLHRTATDIHRPTPSRHRLRVGVLAFHEIDCKNEKGLRLSLSHEIAAGLARFRWFDVISPTSLRRERWTDEQHEYVKLDCVVDGTISGSGRQLQISVRLLDLAGQAQPVWSKRFDHLVMPLASIGQLVTTGIVGRIDPVILHIEGRPKRREHYGAPGLLLRAIPLTFSVERKHAMTQCYIGEPDAALQRLKRYRELTSPELYFSYFEHFFTIAYTFKGDYERAVLVGRCAVKANPDFVNGYKPLIASLGHLGRREEAQVFVNGLLCREPDFTVESFLQMYPIKKSSSSNVTLRACASPAFRSADNLLAVCYRRWRSALPPGASPQFARSAVAEGGLRSPIRTLLLDRLPAELGAPDAAPTTRCSTCSGCARRPRPKISRRVACRSIFALRKRSATAMRSWSCRSTSCVFR
jgi:DNA-binding SARP family transcriptional activator